MVKIYDPSKGIVEETQFAGKALGFLYNSAIGRVLLKSIFIQPWVWKAWAWSQKMPTTVRRVDQYVKAYDIQKQVYVRSDWHSFADFFSRQLKPSSIQISSDINEVIAVAESKILAVPITKDAKVTIKHRHYSLADIVGSEEIANEYKDGQVLVYRLSMHNYHRYIFPDDGHVESQHSYKGILHTVSSLSASYPVYSINQREVSLLHTTHFNQVVMVEVGAMMAGKIVNNSLQYFKRGQEKGRFEIGGSTILVFYKKGIIRLNNTIEKYSKQGIEVAVSIGEGIGTHV